MERLLPSELARLVLGYLHEENFNSLANEFLETSKYLGECLELIQEGEEISTRPYGKDLKEMLKEYCMIQKLILQKIRRLGPQNLRTSLLKLDPVEQLKQLLLLRSGTPVSSAGSQSSQSGIVVKSQPSSVVATLPSQQCTIYTNSQTSKNETEKSPQVLSYNPTVTNTKCQLPQGNDTNLQSRFGHEEEKKKVQHESSNKVIVKENPQNVSFVSSTKTTHGRLNDAANISQNNVLRNETSTPKKEEVRKDSFKPKWTISPVKSRLARHLRKTFQHNAILDPLDFKVFSQKVFERISKDENVKHCCSQNTNPEGIVTSYNDTVNKTEVDPLFEDFVDSVLSGSDHQDQCCAENPSFKKSQRQLVSKNKHVAAVLPKTEFSSANSSTRNKLYCEYRCNSHSDLNLKSSQEKRVKSMKTVSTAKIKRKGSPIGIRASSGKPVFCIPPRDLLFHKTCQVKHVHKNVESSIRVSKSKNMDMFIKDKDCIDSYNKCASNSSLEQNISVEKKTLQKKRFSNVFNETGKENKLKDLSLRECYDGTVLKTQLVVNERYNVAQSVPNENSTCGVANRRLSLNESPQCYTGNVTENESLTDNSVLTNQQAVMVLDNISKANTTTVNNNKSEDSVNLSQYSKQTLDATSKPGITIVNNNNSEESAIPSQISQQELDSTNEADMTTVNSNNYEMNVIPSQFGEQILDVSSKPDITIVNNNNSEKTVIPLQFCQEELNTINKVDTATVNNKKSGMSVITSQFSQQILEPKSKTDITTLDNNKPEVNINPSESNMKTLDARNEVNIKVVKNDESKLNIILSQQQTLNTISRTDNTIVNNNNPEKSVTQSQFCKETLDTINNAEMTTKNINNSDDSIIPSQLCEKTLVAMRKPDMTMNSNNSDERIILSQFSPHTINASTPQPSNISAVNKPLLEPFKPGSVSECSSLMYDSKKKILAPMSPSTLIPAYVNPTKSDIVLKKADVEENNKNHLENVTGEENKSEFNITPDVIEKADIVLVNDDMSEVGVIPAADTSQESDMTPILHSGSQWSEINSQLTNNLILQSNNLPSIQLGTLTREDGSDPTLVMYDSMRGSIIPLSSIPIFDMQPSSPNAAAINAIMKSYVPIVPKILKVRPLENMIARPFSNISQGNLMSVEDNIKTGMPLTTTQSSILHFSDPLHSGIDNTGLRLSSDLADIQQSDGNIQMVVDNKVNIAFDDNINDSNFNNIVKEECIVMPTTPVSYTADNVDNDINKIQKNLKRKAKDKVKALGSSCKIRKTKNQTTNGVRRKSTRISNKSPESLHSKSSKQLKADEVFSMEEFITFPSVCKENFLESENIVPDENIISMENIPCQIVVPSDNTLDNENCKSNKSPESVGLHASYFVLPDSSDVSLSNKINEENCSSEENISKCNGIIPDEKCRKFSDVPSNKEICNDVPSNEDDCKSNKEDCNDVPSNKEDCNDLPSNKGKYNDVPSSNKENRNDILSNKEDCDDESSIKENCNDVPLNKEDFDYVQSNKENLLSSNKEICNDDPSNKESYNDVPSNKENCNYLPSNDENCLRSTAQDIPVSDDTVVKGSHSDSSEEKFDIGYKNEYIKPSSEIFNIKVDQSNSQLLPACYFNTEMEKPIVVDTSESVQSKKIKIKRKCTSMKVSDEVISKKLNRKKLSKKKVIRKAARQRNSKSKTYINVENVKKINSDELVISVENISDKQNWESYGEDEKLFKLKPVVSVDKLKQECIEMKSNNKKSVVIEDVPLLLSSNSVQDKRKTISSNAEIQLNLCIKSNKTVSESYKEDLTKLETLNDNKTCDNSVKIGSDANLNLISMENNVNRTTISCESDQPKNIDSTNICVQNIKPIEYAMTKSSLCNENPKNENTVNVVSNTNPHFMLKEKDKSNFIEASFSDKSNSIEASSSDKSNFIEASSSDKSNKLKNSEVKEAHTQNINLPENVLTISCFEEISNRKTEDDNSIIVDTDTNFSSMQMSNNHDEDSSSRMSDDQENVKTTKTLCSEEIYNNTLENNITGMSNINPVFMQEDQSGTSEVLSPARSNKLENIEAKEAHTKNIILPEEAVTQSLYTEEVSNHKTENDNSVNQALDTDFFLMRMEKITESSSSNKSDEQENIKETNICVENIKQSEEFLTKTLRNEEMCNNISENNRSVNNISNTLEKEEQSIADKITSSSKSNKMENIETDTQNISVREDDVTESFTVLVSNDTANYNHSVKVASETHFTVIQMENNADEALHLCKNNQLKNIEATNTAVENINICREEEAMTKTFGKDMCNKDSKSDKTVNFNSNVNLILTPQKESINDKGSSKSSELKNIEANKACIENIRLSEDSTTESLYTAETSNDRLKDDSTIDPASNNDLVIQEKNDSDQILIPNESNKMETVKACAENITLNATELDNLRVTNELQLQSALYEGETELHRNEAFDSTEESIMSELDTNLQDKTKASNETNSSTYNSPCISEPKKCIIDMKVEYQNADETHCNVASKIQALCDENSRHELCTETNNFTEPSLSEIDMKNIFEDVNKKDKIVANVTDSKEEVISQQTVIYKSNNSPETINLSSPNKNCIFKSFALSVISPVEQQTLSPTDQQISSSIDQQISSSIDQQISSPADKQISSLADMQISSPTDQQISSPTDQQISSSTQQISSPTDQQISSPTDQQISSPTVQQTSSPTDQQISFTAENKNDLSSSEQQTSPLNKQTLIPSRQTSTPIKPQNSFLKKQQTSLLVKSQTFSPFKKQTASPAKHSFSVTDERVLSTSSQQTLAPNNQTLSLTGQKTLTPYKETSAEILSENDQETSFRIEEQMLCLIEQQQTFSSTKQQNSSPNKQQNSSPNKQQISSPNKKQTSTPTERISSLILKDLPVIKQISTNKVLSVKQLTIASNEQTMLPSEKKSRFEVELSSSPSKQQTFTPVEQTSLPVKQQKRALSPIEQQLALLHGETDAESVPSINASVSTDLQADELSCGNVSPLTSTADTLLKLLTDNDSVENDMSIFFNKKFIGKNSTSSLLSFLENPSENPSTHNPKFNTMVDVGDMKMENVAKTVKSPTYQQIFSSESKGKVGKALLVNNKKGTLIGNEKILSDISKPVPNNSLSIKETSFSQSREHQETPENFIFPSEENIPIISVSTGNENKTVMSVLYKDLGPKRRESVLTSLNKSDTNLEDKSFVIECENTKNMFAIEPSPFLVLFESQDFDLEASECRDVVVLDSDTENEIDEGSRYSDDDLNSSVIIIEPERNYLCVEKLECADTCDTKGNELKKMHNTNEYFARVEHSYEKNISYPCSSMNTQCGNGKYQCDKKCQCYFSSRKRSNSDGHCNEHKKYCQREQESDGSHAECDENLKFCHVNNDENKKSVNKKRKQACSEMYERNKKRKRGEKWLLIDLTSDDEMDSPRCRSHESIHNNEWQSYSCKDETINNRCNNKTEIRENTVLLSDTNHSESTVSRVTCHNTVDHENNPCSHNGSSVCVKISSNVSKQKHPLTPKKNLFYRSSRTEVFQNSEVTECDVSEIKTSVMSQKTPSHLEPYKEDRSHYNRCRRNKIKLISTGPESLKCKTREQPCDLEADNVMASNRNADHNKRTTSPFEESNNLSLTQNSRKSINLEKSKMSTGGKNFVKMTDNVDTESNCPKLLLKKINLDQFLSSVHGGKQS